MRSYVVGLTGGVGSGKSTIAHLFAQLKTPVIDADVVAREVVAKDSPLLEQIVAHFGASVLLEDGELNRPVLRQIVFGNEQHKSWLNHLMHPAIRQRMQQKLVEQTAPYVIFMVPLLIENQLTHWCQRILVVDVLPETQLQRTLKRDGSDVDVVKNIMTAQIKREDRLNYADDVIENNQDLKYSLSRLTLQVEQLHQQYLKLAKAFATLPQVTQ